MSTGITISAGDEQATNVATTPHAAPDRSHEQFFVLRPTAMRLPLSERMITRSPCSVVAVFENSVHASRQDLTDAQHRTGMREGFARRQTRTEFDDE